MNRLLIVVLAALLVVAGGLLLLRRPPAPEPEPGLAATAEPTPPAATGRQPPVDRAEVNRVAQALAAAIREQRAAATITGLAQQQNGAQLARALYERTDDQALRQAAIDLAARSGDPAGVRWLSELAREDAVNGPRAAATLGSVTSKAAAPELAALLATHQSPAVRASAARALGASGSADQAPILGEALGSPVEELRVRQEAALALGQIGGLQAVTALAAAWERSGRDRSPTGEELRLSIIQGLGRIDSPPARAALQKVASGELSPTERAFLTRTSKGAAPAPAISR